MNPPFTQWFDGAKDRPVHVGVYPVKGEHRPIAFQHWNGEFWGLRHHSPNFAGAHVNRVNESCWQEPTWRGLAVKP